MTLSVFGGAALLVAGAVLVGEAARSLGLRCRAAAPAVGLSLLIVLAAVAIKLPGRAVTAAVALLVTIVAAAILVAVRHRREGMAMVRGLAVPLTAGILAAAGAAIPFLANGRVGLLGVSFDNDTASHLLWAETLRSPSVADRYGPIPTGYPLGPHSLADAIGTGLGLRLDLAFTALLVAIPMITALVASAALRDQAGWKRVVTGVLAALFYLVAGYYGEGAFKETMLALLLLGFVLQLEEVRDQWTPRAAGQWRALVPASVLVAGSIYVYSYLAIAWIGLSFFLWLAAEAVSRPGRWRDWRTQLRGVVAPGLAACCVLLVVLAPDAGRIFSFAGSIGVSPAGTGAIASSNLGNLAYPLSPYEALGIWNSPDFRVVPANAFHAGELGAFALAVLAFGLIMAVSRRDLVLPAAVAACAVIYWVSSRSQSPYVTAKALAVAAPVVAVIGMRALLRSTRSPLPRWTEFLRLAAALAFIILAGYCSVQVLRNAPVWPGESTSELLSLDHVTRGQPVLFLGNSDYAAWLFSDSKMSALATNSISMDQASWRPTKPFVYGSPLDFDSVDPASLNRFRWVITSNTTYASAPPAGFVLARRLPLYQLWERVAAVQSRRVLEAPGAPGAILDCRDRLARALSRRPGIAAVSPAPVTAGMPVLTPGAHATVSLKLPAGTWDLSLQYESAVPLSLSAEGRQWQMPAYIDRPGPFFSVGRVISPGGTVRVAVAANRPSLLTGSHLIAEPIVMAAVREPDRRVLVPLRQACGRYVDWYQTSSN